jgi:hypothetical protein
MAPAVPFGARAHEEWSSREYNAYPAIDHELHDAGRQVGRVGDGVERPSRRRAAPAWVRQRRRSPGEIIGSSPDVHNQIGAEWRPLQQPMGARRVVSAA